MPINLLVIIYYNLVLWLCFLPKLGCHSKPRHLENSSRGQFRCYLTMKPTQTLLKYSCLYLWHILQLIGPLFFYLNVLEKRRQMSQSSPGQTLIFLFLSPTPNAGNICFLKKKSLNKYWEMSLLPVLGIEAFCQICVSMCGVEESLILKTFIKCLLWANMVLQLLQFLFLEANGLWVEVGQKPK